MMKTTSVRGMCGILLSWTVSCSVFAVLMPANDVVFGVASITRDTDTGLEWLDVPLSQARTYLDVAGQFGPGGDFVGFRHATGDELVQLFTNAGIPNINSAASAANVVAATALLDLVGATALQGSNPEVFGFLSDVGLDPDSRFNGELAFVDIGVDAYAATTNQISRNEGVEFNSVGHWLVRVPEPGTGLMWGWLIWAFLRWRGHPTRVYSVH